MKVKSTSVCATDAPPEYQDLLALILEAQLTIRSISCFITTRETASPMATNWIKERLEYINAKLEAANQEIS
jgi:uncharacterized protein (UPF0210 family)